MTRFIATRCRNANRNLGRRGIYGSIGGNKDSASANMAMLWILNLSDGTHSLLDIAERADLPFSAIEERRPADGSRISWRRSKYATINLTDINAAVQVYLNML
jgi:hypothetical protein